jgi:hypothetical protein
VLFRYTAPPFGSCRQAANAMVSCTPPRVNRHTNEPPDAVNLPATHADVLESGRSERRAVPFGGGEAAKRQQLEEAA